MDEQIIARWVDNRRENGWMNNVDGGWMIPPEAPPSVRGRLLTCVCAMGGSGRTCLRGWQERGRGDGGGGRGSGSRLGVGRSCCVQRAGRAPPAAAISSPICTMSVSSCFTLTSERT